MFIRRYILYHGGYTVISHAHSFFVYFVDPTIGPDFYPEEYFDIDPFTGVVFNKIPLDLESFPFNVHPDNNRWRILVRVCTRRSGDIISDSSIDTIFLFAS